MAWFFEPCLPIEWPDDYIPPIKIFPPEPTKLGWDTDFPFFDYPYYHIWFPYGALGSTEADDPADMDNPALYVYDIDLFQKKDWHYLGPSEMNYDYFEKFVRFRRPFEEIHKYLLIIIDQMIQNEGELEEKTKWVSSLVLQTSVAIRHRHMGVRLMEDIFFRKYPPSPTMYFHLTLTRIRDGNYQLAMDYMKVCRLIHPGYGRNVALEKYLKVKIKERQWGKKRFAIFHCLTIAVMFFLGGRTAWM